MAKRAMPCRTARVKERAGREAGGPHGQESLQSVQPAREDRIIHTGKHGVAAQVPAPSAWDGAAHAQIHGGLHNSARQTGCASREGKDDGTRTRESLEVIVRPGSALGGHAQDACPVCD